MRFLRSIGWRLLSIIVIAAFYAMLRDGFGLRLAPFRSARESDACLIPGMRTLGHAQGDWAVLICRGGRWILPRAPVKP